MLWVLIGHLRRPGETCLPALCREWHFELVQSAAVPLKAVRGSFEGSSFRSLLVHMACRYDFNFRRNVCSIFLLRFQHACTRMQLNCPNKPDTNEKANREHHHETHKIPPQVYIKLRPYHMETSLRHLKSIKSHHRSGKKITATPPNNPPKPIGEPPTNHLPQKSFEHHVLNER